MSILKQFFYMNGYGVYVFSAYGFVTMGLLVQWFLVSRKYRKLMKSSNKIAK